MTVSKPRPKNRAIKPSSAATKLSRDEELRQELTEEFAESPPLLQQRQAAEILNVSVRTIMRLVEHGSLAIVALNRSEKGRVRIRKRSLIDHLVAQTMGRVGVQPNLAIVPGDVRTLPVTEAAR